MLAQRRMFRTITGKRFCPIAAIAAPKAFGRARLADESPARLWQSKGRFGRGLGNPHGWILGECKRGLRVEEPSGKSEVPKFASKSLHDA